MRRSETTCSKKHDWSDIRVSVEIGTLGAPTRAYSTVQATVDSTLTPHNAQGYTYVQYLWCMFYRISGDAVFESFGGPGGTHNFGTNQ